MQKKHNPPETSGFFCFMNGRDSQSLFDTGEELDLGLGFHNVGSGVLRYSHEDTILKVEKHYGQRCGHFPLNAKQIGVLVELPDEEIRSQMAYLSALFGREIRIMTSADVKQYVKTEHKQPLIVPYGPVPETEEIIHKLGARSWGLPGKMTHILKNKSEFYQLVDELAVEGFHIPTYTIAPLPEVAAASKKFLTKVEEMYRGAGVNSSYPLGIMLRASDEDGNYGCALAYEKGRFIIVVPDGESENSQLYGNWNEALGAIHRILASAMDAKKEPRVVISRYVDLADSPGLSLVMDDGVVTSLGWNGQLQKEGSKACVGTSSYHPKNAHLRKAQLELEAYTVEVFEKFLRKTAAKLGIDFNQIRGIANIDIMLPSDLEKRFHEKVGKKLDVYFAECNPRWTNYTDAILTVCGVQKQVQSVATMKKIIKEGISTMDKYKLPVGADPKIIRELMFEKDQELQKSGTRLICRMAKSPMGLIFAGDVQKAEQAMAEILRSVAGNNRNSFASSFQQDDVPSLTDSVTIAQTK